MSIYILQRSCSSARGRRDFYPLVSKGRREFQTYFSTLVWLLPLSNAQYATNPICWLRVSATIVSILTFRRCPITTHATSSGQGLRTLALKAIDAISSSKIQESSDREREKELEEKEQRVSGSISGRRSWKVNPTATLSKHIESSTQRK